MSFFSVSEDRKKNSAAGMIDQRGRHHRVTRGRRHRAGADRFLGLAEPRGDFLVACREAWPASQDDATIARRETGAVGIGADQFCMNMSLRQPGDLRPEAVADQRDDEQQDGDRRGAPALAHHALPDRVLRAEIQVGAECADAPQRARHRVDLLGRQVVGDDVEHRGEQEADHRHDGDGLREAWRPAVDDEAADEGAEAPPRAPAARRTPTRMSPGSTPWTRWTIGAWKPVRP